MTTATTVRANGTDLYAETRGSGPALLLVPGATGDGGQYDLLADALAATHTVVTYDRRGNSRSPAPDGQTSTSIDEQADDAAALLRALNLAPARVFGNSHGALVALALALRHPDVVVDVALHEPALMSVLAEPDAALAVIQPIIGEGMAAGGPRGGAEAFLRFAAGTAYEALSSATADRMLGNAETLFEREFGAFAAWRPDAAELARLGVPVRVLAAAESAPFFAEAAAWIARQVGTDVRTVPGGHMAFLDRPDDIAAAIVTP